MGDLFQGYVECKNKKCIEKIKNRSEFKSFDQVKNLPEYAGILAKDTILIDIDEELPANILYKIVTNLDLKCRVYQTTRGKHFLFRNNGVVSNKTHANLGIGIPADIKLGTRNSYEVLKFDGKEREILRDSDEIQTVPKWLFPVPANVDFLNLSAGDGRNQTLFNYILTLQSHDFNQEEARECIRLINKYVLKNPLPKSEIETVLRDEAFQKPVFFNGSTFLFDKFADFFRRSDHVIKIGKSLHIYKDGIYLGGPEAIESAMIRHFPLNTTRRREVWNYLRLSQVENRTNDSNLIAFRNGVYDLVANELKPFSPNYVITNKLNWDYNPNAYSELVDKTLSKLACKDDQIRALLEEMVGYCFYRRNELGKAFILTGDQSNGKSTFLYMIQAALGEENIAALDLKQLGDKFKTAELFGKLANIGDDIGDEFIADTSIFKKLVTGDRTIVERKGQDPFEFNNYSKLLFSANTVPHMEDKTGAVRRRMLIIPFNATFSPNDSDYHPYIKYELTKSEGMEYLIKLGIAGLKRVLTKQAFTESQKVQDQLVNFDKENNPILLFIEEVGGETAVENETTAVIYRKYTEFCYTNNYRPLSNNTFTKQVKKRLGFETKQIAINGKRPRIFTRE